MVRFSVGPKLAAVMLGEVFLAFCRGLKQPVLVFITKFKLDVFASVPLPRGSLPAFLILIFSRTYLLKTCLLD